MAYSESVLRAAEARLAAEFAGEYFLDVDSLLHPLFLFVNSLLQCAKILIFLKVCNYFRRKSGQDALISCCCHISTASAGPFRAAPRSDGRRTEKRASYT